MLLIVIRELVCKVALITVRDKQLILALLSTSCLSVKVF